MSIISPRKRGPMFSFKVVFIAIQLILISQVYSADINFRSASKVTSKSGATIYTIGLLDSGEEVLRPVYELAEGHEISFRPNVYFPGEHYLNQEGSKKVIRGRYFGSLLISTTGLSGSERQAIDELNKKKIFIYEWKIDKADYIIRAFNDNPIRPQLIPREEAFLWDSVNPKQSWTSIAASFINSNKSIFFDEKISDIQDFCPGFLSKTNEQKTAFWIHLLNSLSLRESKFDPMVSNNEGNFGDGSLNVTSRGLLQISYQSSKASRYKRNGCDVDGPNSLHDPETSIECGLAIFKTWLKEDGCISCKGRGNRYLGISRYWSPLRARHQVRCSICSSGVANIGYREEIIKEISNTQACQ